MENDNERETGARVLQSKRFPDANDEVSQEAAKNKKPPLGVGLTEKLFERSEGDKSDLVDAPSGRPESDAQGQSSQGDSTVSAISSNPRVLSRTMGGNAPVKDK